MIAKEKLQFRLLSKYKIDENNCWNFIGALRAGYGVLKINKKLISTHRLSYELFIGEIPDNKNVCHKCDNRQCVNPNHLFLGTQSDNMKDCFKKGRMVLPRTSRFKANHYPKNTTIPESLALEIKQIVLNRSDKKLISIANDFNIPYQYVRDISANRILKNR